MSINYFLEEIHGKGYERVKVFLVIRHKMKLQVLRFWIINKLLSPLIKIEIRKAVVNPNSIIGCLECAKEVTDDIENIKKIEKSLIEE
jgi:hypothetical protein